MRHSTFTQALNEPLSEKNVADHVDAIIRGTHIPAYLIAQGLGIPEKYLARIKTRRHHPRQEVLRQIERVQTLVQDAFQTMRPEGAVEWLKTPNPYLNDVAPIQCLRSDKELDRVRAVLAAIKYGFAT